MLRVKLDSFLIRLMNAWHRVMRGLYLQYGVRSGRNSLDPLPGVCLVHGPSDGREESWVERLMGEVPGKLESPVLFCFFGGADELRHLYQFRTVLVDHTVSERFLEKFEYSRYGVGRVVVVGGEPFQPELLGRETKSPAGWVEEPPAGGGLVWLHQFS